MLFNLNTIRKDLHESSKKLDSYLSYHSLWKWQLWESTKVDKYFLNTVTSFFYSLSKFLFYFDNNAHNSTNTIFLNKLNLWTLDNDVMLNLCDLFKKSKQESYYKIKEIREESYIIFKANVLIEFLTRRFFTDEDWNIIFNCNIDYDENFFLSFLENFKDDYYVLTQIFISEMFKNCKQETFFEKFIKNNYEKIFNSTNYFHIHFVDFLLFHEVNHKDWRINEFSNVFISFRRKFEKQEVDSVDILTSYFNNFYNKWRIWNNLSILNKLEIKPEREFSKEMKKIIKESKELIKKIYDNEENKSFKYDISEFLKDIVNFFIFLYNFDEDFLFIENDLF